MSATTARKRLAEPFEIVQVTQRWTIEHGTFYRDCVVLLSDGSRRLVGIRDDLVTVAA